MAVLSIAVSLTFAAITAESIISVTAIPNSFSATAGLVASATFSCSVLANTSLLNLTSTNQVTLVPRVISNNKDLGDVFTAGDCASAVIGDLTNLDFIPSLVQISTGTGDNASFTTTWRFCYRARRAGDDLINFVCETNTGSQSQQARVTISIGDDTLTARGFYFGMAPFVLVFAIILLCNIVLWKRMVARRARQGQTNTTARSDGATGGSGFSAPKSKPGGLVPEAIANIESHEINDEAKIMLDEMCVICQSEYEPGEKYKKLKCGHSFHSECIDVWLAKSAHCPICIADMSMT